jgi:HK97 family phage portal protein
MNRLQQAIKVLFGKKTQALPRPLPWQLSEADRYRYDMPDMGIVNNQVSLYRLLSWVQIAVSLTARYAASAELEVYQSEGEDETEVANHPFELLLQRPNPLQSRLEFLVDTFSAYQLAGNAYWFLNRTSENAPPSEMWCIPPQCIRPVPDGKSYLRGYVFQEGGTEIALDLWQIAHFKTYNPNNPFVGLSPVEAIAIDAASDLNAAKWNADHWGKNNGRIPGILSFESDYSDEQWDKLKRNMRDDAANRNIMLLRGVGQGKVNWLANAMSQKDMEFLTGRQFTKEEIFAVFAPGLSSVLSINATEANAKTGKGTLTDMMIYPMHCAIAEKITNDILPAYGDNLRARFEDIRMSDRAMELAEINEYGKYHTVNEVRTKYYNDEPLQDTIGSLLVAQVTAASAPIEPETPTSQEHAAIPVTPPGEETPSMWEQPQNAVEAELRKWKRCARKAMKAGRPANVYFECESIPSSDQERIRAALVKAQDVDELDNIFTASPVDPIMALTAELKRANDLLERETE